MTTIEQVFDFPREFVENNVGLGIDIGGSCIKFVYRHKDEWNDLQLNKELTLGRMRMRTCARDGLGDMIKHLKQHCHITRNSDGFGTVGCTGVGGMQFGEILKQELKVELDYNAEFDCFVKSFDYLHRNFARRTIVFPPCQDIIDKEHTRRNKLRTVFEKFKEFSSVKLPAGDDDKTEDQEANIQVENEDYKPLSEAENIFPYMLAMVGSGSGFIKVDRDGKYSIKDGSQRAGKYFLGLGSLLTEAQTFDELISLASEGNANNVGTTTETLKNEQQLDDCGEPDSYSSVMTDDDLPVELRFCFGQTVNKDKESFSREDLAAAVLEHVCSDLVHTIHQTCRLYNIKHAFFCGGFPSVPHVQRIITDFWYRREFDLSMTRGNIEVKLNFLPQGQFLGALGTIIT